MGSTLPTLQVAWGDSLPKSCHVPCGPESPIRPGRKYPRVHACTEFVGIGPGYFACILLSDMGADLVTIRCPMPGRHARSTV